MFDTWVCGRQLQCGILEKFLSLLKCNCLLQKYASNDGTCVIEPLVVQNNDFGKNRQMRSQKSVLLCHSLMLNVVKVVQVLALKSSLLTTQCHSNTC